MSGLISKLFIFIVLMITGYVCARRGVLSKTFTREASKLTIDFFMSFTIINSVISMDGSIDGKKLTVALLIFSVTMLICYAVGFVSKRLSGNDRDRASLFEILLAAPNIMFIALPVLDQICGAESVFYCSLTGIPYNLLLYSYGIYRIRGSREKISLKSTLSMPLIATLIAAGIFLAGIELPQALRELISAASGATMPLSMIVIGSALGNVSLADTFRSKSLYLMSLLRLIVTPVLVWLIVGSLASDQVILTTAVIMSAAPSGLTVSILSVQYDRYAVYTSEGVLLSTALSMLTIPLLLYALPL